MKSQEVGQDLKVIVKVKEKVKVSISEREELHLLKPRCLYRIKL